MTQNVITAYNQIVRNKQGDLETIKQLIDYCKKRDHWNDLEYYSNLYFNQFPQETWLRYYHALALDKTGRLQSAINEYKSILKDGLAENTDIYYRLARGMNQLGLSSQAELLFKDALEKTEADKPILSQRAMYYLDNDELAAAVNDLDAIRGESKVTDFEDITSLKIAARIAKEQDDLALAERLMHKCVTLPGCGKDEYFLLFSIYEEQGKYDEALETIDGLDPYLRINSQELLLYQHHLLVVTSQIETARAVREEYGKAYPQQTMFSEYMLARELLMEGNAAAAAAKLTNVVDKIPGFQQGHYFLIVSQLQAGQRQRARAALEIYLHAFPGDEKGQQILEREFARKSPDRQLAQDARALLQQEDAPVQDLLRLGMQLIDASVQSGGDLSGISLDELFQEIISRAPDLEEGYLAYADYNIRQGQLDEARTVLSQAEQNIEKLKNGDLVHAWILLAENKVDEAVALFNAELANTDIDIARIRYWANSFAARQHIDAGMRVLRSAQEKLPPEESQKLLADTLALCTRFGKLDLAIKEMETLDQNLSDTLKTSPLVFAEKEQLSMMLMRSEKPGHLEKAQAIVNELAAQQPDDKRLKLLKIQVLLRQTPPDYETCWDILTQMNQADPLDTEVMTMMADVAFQEGDAIAALEYAGKAAAAAPQNSAVQLSLARIQLKSKKFIEAQATLEKLLALKPNDPEIMEMLFNAYLATGRKAQAEGILSGLETLLNNEKDAWRLALLRAQIDVAYGTNLNAVENMYRERYVRNPDDVYVLRELAMVVARQGREKEAERLLQGFAENHPDSENAWTILGQYYLATKDSDALMKASSAFTKALIINPSYGDALRGVIDLNLRSQNFGQALMLCDRYLKLHPASPDILRTRAILLAEFENDTEAALENINRAIDLDRQDDFLLFRGYILLSQEQYTEALQDFQEVGRSRDVNPIELDMYLAKTYLGLKQLDRAERYYEAARRKMDNGGAGNTVELEKIAENIEALRGEIQ